MDDRYLLSGLDAMARAPGRDYFRDGHLGASVIAAYYLCREQALDPDTQGAIRSRIDAELLPEPIFSPAPEEPADEKLLTTIQDALADGADDLREAGHNVIFTAAASKAFARRPDAATPFRVEGIAALIRSFHVSEAPDPKPDDGIPTLDDEEAFVEFLFREFLRTAAAYSGRGHGWTGHLLTFGHALLELKALGLPSLADRARGAFRRYVARVRAGPLDGDRPMPDHPPSPHTPLGRAYWERRRSVRAGLGHAFKYAYSFYNLLGRLRDEELEARSVGESYKIF